MGQNLIMDFWPHPVLFTSITAMNYIVNDELIVTGLLNSMYRVKMHISKVA